jgi:lipoate-protein ligase A
VEGRIHWSDDGLASGRQNMDRDRAMWRELEADPRLEVRLRVYGWRPAALSLGFHQPEALVDRAALEAAGVDLVRRPTGGAAVLHADEITYAVAAPLSTPGLGRAVLEIHAAIADCLSVALAGRGVRADLGGGGAPTGFACFSAAGGHEMTVGGRKLVGSALRRGRRAFLQHGSILVGPAHLELFEYLRDVEPGERERRRAELADRTCTLRSVARSEIHRGDFARGLVRALASRTGYRPEPDPGREPAVENAPERP